VPLAWIAMRLKGEIPRRSPRAVDMARLTGVEAGLELADNTHITACPTMRRRSGARSST